MKLRPAAASIVSAALVLAPVSLLSSPASAVPADCTTLGTVTSSTTCVLADGDTISYSVHGANGGGSYGGKGALVEGEYTNSSGSDVTLYLTVGTDGTDTGDSSGGGGYSAIALSAYDGTPLVVAGGGGGYGMYGGSGGDAGAAPGSGAGDGGSGCCDDGSGGGDQNVAGAGGASEGTPDEIGGAGGAAGMDGSDGLIYLGEDGGSGAGGGGFGALGGSVVSCSYTAAGGSPGGGQGCYGGGGGAGWAGGGGGGGGPWDNYGEGGGGGGGSSLVPSGATMSVGTASASIALAPVAAPAPTVSSVTPSSGTTAGGTDVTITGTGFAAGASVTFGGNSATSVAVLSDTSITATTPAGSAGAVDVVVTNTDAQSGTGSGVFTYQAPAPAPSGGGSSAPAASTPTTAAPSAPPAAPVSQPSADPLAAQPVVLPAGGSQLLVNGQPSAVTVVPNAGRNPTSLLVSAPGLNMSLEGRGDSNDPLGLTSKQALILQSDPLSQAVYALRAAKAPKRVQPVARSTGDGFMPNSVVKMYILPGTYLGELPTDASGAYSGSLPIPAGIATGEYTLQANGFTPDGSVRSLSIGVLVKAGAKSSSARASVFFAPLSAQLDAADKATLRKLVSKTGKKVSTVVSVGFVQPVGGKANDSSLSSARATAVAKYLRSLGVSGKFTVRGSGRDSSTGAQARRVDVKITYSK